MRTTRSRMPGNVISGVNLRRVEHQMLVDLVADHNGIRPRCGARDDFQFARDRTRGRSD